MIELTASEIIRVDTKKTNQYSHSQGDAGNHDFDAFKRI